MAHPEASTRPARVPDPPVFLDAAALADKRRLALEYAQDVLHAPPERAGLDLHRHALLVVVHELEQIDQRYRNFGGIARAREVLDAARRPDRCPGSARFVYATATDGDGVTNCPGCGRPRLTTVIPGCDRWRVVEDHGTPPAERPTPRAGTIMLTDPAERRP